MSTPETHIELVLEWFDDCAKACDVACRVESAMLWRDGKAHLIHAVEQRDTAWAELREIRDAIKANPEESTADEVRRVVAQRDELLEALKEYIASLENCVTADDDVAAMVRHGIASDNAKSIIKKVEQS